jgi:hypothetical protein
MGLISGSEAAWSLMSRQPTIQEEEKAVVRANKQVFNSLISVSSAEEFLRDTNRVATALEAKIDKYCNQEPSENNLTLNSCVSQYDFLRSMLSDVSGATAVSGSASMVLATDNFNSMWSSSSMACSAKPGRELLTTEYYLQMCEFFKNKKDFSLQTVRSRVKQTVDDTISKLEDFNRVQSRLNESRRAEEQRKLRKEVNKKKDEIKVLQQEKNRLNQERKTNASKALSNAQKIKLQNLEKKLLAQKMNLQTLQANLNALNQGWVKTLRGYAKGGAHILGLDSLAAWLTGIFTNTIYIIVSVAGLGLIGTNVGMRLLRHLLNGSRIIIDILVNLVVRGRVGLPRATAWAMRSLQGLAANFFARPERRNQNIRNLRNIQRRTAEINNNNVALLQGFAQGANREARNLRQGANDLMYLMAGGS